MPGMTDRDHFAAAALTGLLAQGDDGSFSEESYVRGAYRWADAMLRERERTNHDAAPAARASVESVAPQPTTRGDSDRTDKAAPRPSEGTGDTPATHATRGEGSVQRECTEPVAWAVVSDSKEEIDCEFVYPDEATAGDVALDSNGGVVPLYRQQPCQDFWRKNLTLTDAEREAVEWASLVLRNTAEELDQHGDYPRRLNETAALMLNLLQRLK